MISVTRLFHVVFLKKYSIVRSFSQKSLSLYAVTLKPATLATLLNFERNGFSELI